MLKKNLVIFFDPRVSVSHLRNYIRNLVCTKQSSNTRNAQEPAQGRRDSAILRADAKRDAERVTCLLVCWSIDLSYVIPYTTGIRALNC